MRRNKALLPWQGMRLVDIVAKALKEAGIADIYVSGEVEGYPTIPDLSPEQGPVGGIISVVQRLHASYGRLLFVPVDMPLLKTNCLHALLADDSKIAARHFHKHPLPCLLQLDERLVVHTQRIQQWMAEGEAYSMKRYLEELGTHVLPVPAGMERSLTNANTPEEWREAIGEPAHQ